MQRRDLLTLAPVALIGCAAPVGACALNFEETPIMTLFRQFVVLTEAARVHPSTKDEELDQLFYDDLDRIEDAMMAIPSVTAQDMAAKALVSHCHGDMSCLDYARSPFWAEARALVGVHA